MSKVVRNLIFIILTVLFVSLSLASQKQPAARESYTVRVAEPTANAADYVGPDTCAQCHVDQAEAFHKTVHSAEPKAGEIGYGCESCHGPGKAHVEGIQSSDGDLDKIEAAKKRIYSFQGSVPENSDRCLNCHRSSQDQQNFDRSEHHFNGVACQTCHEPHLTGVAADQPAQKALLPQRDLFVAVPKKEVDRWLSSSLLRKSQPELCSGCHGTVMAQFTLPSHHRVPEGLMKCTDCHSTHGTRNQPSLKKVAWEGCIGCHSEKRGPYVFEHAAVKVEGCTACHSPHGTVNRMLLLRTEGRFLCLQCHVNPQAPNVPHGRLGFQTSGECVRCHVAVHGSNSSEFFLD